MFEQIKNNPHGKRLVEDSKTWMKTSPLFTITVFAISLAIFILSIPFDMDDIFGNMPSKTLGKLQIYRFVLYPLVNPTFIGFVLSIILYLPVLGNLERTTGTVKTLGYFLLKNLEIGLSYCLVCALLSNFYDPLGSLPSYSLWPIFFTYMTQKSLEKPEEFQPLLQFQFMNIKNKYYPWILAALYILLVHNNGLIPIDIIIAIGLGFIGKWTEPYYGEILSDAKVYEIEQHSKLTTIKSNSRFVSIYQNLQANLINNDSMKEHQIHIHNAPMNPIADTEQGSIRLNDQIQYAPSEDYPKFKELSVEELDNSSNKTQDLL